MSNDAQEEFRVRALDEPAQPPSYEVELHGKYVTIVAMQSEHADELYKAVSGPENAPLFAYLFDEPPKSIAAFRATLVQKAQTTNPWSYTILSKTSMGSLTPIGMASLMRMDLANRVIEVGSILYTPALQRTPAATEAMYLLAKNVFDLGFRRYEWKCNVLNEPSKRAAVRLGFTYEGTFRQHMILKGRNRDTAWYAMIDAEWPVVQRAMEQWLHEDNFDAAGRQRKKLEDFRQK